jgi:hypothetical protein
MLERNEKKKCLRGFRNGWKDNIKVDLKEMHTLDLSGSVYETVTSS